MMRKAFIAIGIFTLVNATPIQIHATDQLLQEPETPAYAKWGQLALKVTKSKYPDANIIDYLHEGSESKGDSTIQKFKLWLKHDEGEFGVFVRIEYNTATEQVVKIEFQETLR